MKEVADKIRATVEAAIIQFRETTDQEASIKPSPTKWSQKEILGHLIDSAGNNQQKFVRAMQQPHTDFVGYAQDFWVAAQRYNDNNWLRIIALWVAMQRHIAFIIENVPPSALDNTISIDGSEPFTLRFIMEDYGEHLTHHLKQIFPNGGFVSRFSNVYNA